MTKNGKALRPVIRPRELKPYKTRRVEFISDLAMQCFACAVTVLLTLLAILFSTKFRHMMSKAFSHKFIYRYMQKYQNIERSAYPIVTYGIPGTIWTNSGYNKTFGEENENSKSEETKNETEEEENFDFEFKENNEENQPKDGLKQDVFDINNSENEEKIGIKAIEENMKDFENFQGKEREEV